MHGCAAGFACRRKKGENMERYLGESTPKLGFGFMRLPKLEDGTIDLEQTKQMVDRFMDAGLTYFDTAFVYDNGASEAALKAALIDRYPRESFTVATKLNAWMQAPTKEAAHQQFFTSLERTGAGYFDYYLLHAVQKNNIAKYDEYDAWNFVKEQRDAGLIKHWGFSFHDSPEFLDQLLTEHPDVDFIQLQINYADWEDPKQASRANWEVARRHGVPVVVMEPVKGGLLANPVPRVADILRAANPDASYASWAIRFAASLDGIITVLSGMSNFEQVEDNVSYMRDFTPLSTDELAVIEHARQELTSVDSIPCTACHYCTDGCPQNIPIPDIFSAYNRRLVWDDDEGARKRYAEAVSAEGAGRASDCIACGQCEGACPQSLPVIELLKKCAEVFDA